MTYGWNTKKTETGFIAKVYSYDDHMEILKSARFPTRARAEGFAKRWVLYYRRGGK